MERMSQAPEKEALEAPNASKADTSAVADESTNRRSAGFQWPRSLQATATRRALLLTALRGLLIAGVVTAIPVGGPGQGRLSGYLDTDPVPSTGSKSNAAFNRATSGECLMWPAPTPAAAR